MVPIERWILTKSDCYQAGRTIVPRGIMVHSTGVAQPDPEAFCRQWDRPGVDACVHAFVAEDRIVQTLPWNWRGWHAGRGTENICVVPFFCLSLIFPVYIFVLIPAPIRRADIL